MEDNTRPQVLLFTRGQKCGGRYLPQHMENLKSNNERLHFNTTFYDRVLYTIYQLHGAKSHGRVGVVVASYPWLLHEKNVVASVKKFVLHLLLVSCIVKKMRPTPHFWSRVYSISEVKS